MTKPRCCSNHSSLKDKWSHNKQSSPIGYQVKSGGITRELDKEPSLHYSSIYTTTLWFMIQQCVYLMFIHHASYMCPDIIPLISTIQVHTMCTPWGTIVPWHHLLTLTPSRLFPILLDPKSFQTVLNSITWLLGHVPISYPFVYCRLIKYYYNIFTLS